jgi:acetolactate decarboxylase
MKNYNKMMHVVISITLSILISGCQSSSEPVPMAQNQDTLFQYSTIATLLQGVYDGDMTCGELKENGDFGLGTFNALDGEMVVLDSQVYQVASDGIARVMQDDVKIPFAAVTDFKSDKTITTNQSMDCTELKAYIDDKLPTKNIAYAIKINGLFSYVKTRSVPKQSKPYPVLAEVVKTQPTFEFSKQTGSMIGFRLPRYMGGANAAGYHLHFLTVDKDAGGHVLECQVGEIKIEIDYISKWQTVLPSDSEFYNAYITDEVYE